jgi:hypothetical protein
MNQPNNQYNAYPPVPLTTSGWSIFSLIAGILAWLGVFGLGGLAAVIAGHVAKNEIKNSAGRVGGNGLATAGLVLGYINLALAIVGLCVGILIFMGVLTAPVCMIPFLQDTSGGY